MILLKRGGKRIIMKVYTLDILQTNETKICEVFDFEDTYYVVTLNGQNQAGHWKVNKMDKSVTVSSWPLMLTETKGKIGDDYMISVEEFRNRMK